MTLPHKDSLLLNLPSKLIMELEWLDAPQYVRDVLLSVSLPPSFSFPHSEQQCSRHMPSSLLGPGGLGVYFGPYTQPSSPRVL